MKVYLIGRDGAWHYSLTAPAVNTTRPTVGPFATQDDAKAAAQLVGTVKRRLEATPPIAIEWVVEPRVSKVLRWSAQRSGATMTVVGVDDSGAPVKITNVDTIERREDGVTATSVDGTETLLA